MSVFLINFIIALNTISFITSFVFIIQFFCSKSPTKLYLKLIFYIQFCDAIFALGLILFLIPFGVHPNFYYFPSYLMQFGALASALTRLAITLLMYFALRSDDLFNKNRETCVFMAINVVALILSAM